MAPAPSRFDLSFEEGDARIRKDHQLDKARRSQEPSSSSIMAPSSFASMAPSRFIFASSFLEDAAEITDVSAESSPQASPEARPIEGDLSSIDSFILNVVNVAVPENQGCIAEDSDAGTDVNELLAPINDLDAFMASIICDEMGIEVFLKGDADAFVGTNEEPVTYCNAFGTAAHLCVVPSDNGMDMEVFLNEDSDASISSNHSVGAIQHQRFATADDSTVADLLRVLSEDFDDALMSSESLWIPDVPGDVLLPFDVHSAATLAITENASICSDVDVDSFSSREQASSEDVLLIHRDVLEQFHRNYLSSGKSAAADTHVDDENVLGYQERDILYGRGGKLNKHEGNVALRERAEELRVVYLSTKRKKVKKMVSQMLVDSFHREGVRFLKECSTTGKWMVVSNEEARIKAGQVLCQPYDPEKAAIKRALYPKKSAKEKASTKT